MRQPARRRRSFASVVFVLLVCGVVAVGFERGWFQLSTREDTARNEVHVDLTLDRTKFQNDAEKAIDRTRHQASRLSDSIQRQTSKLGGRTPEQEPPARL
jgi:hypothetical protein